MNNTTTTTTTITTTSTTGTTMMVTNKPVTSLDHARIGEVVLRALEDLSREEELELLKTTEGDIDMEEGMDLSKSVEVPAKISKNQGETVSAVREKVDLGESHRETGSWLYSDKVEVKLCRGEQTKPDTTSN